VYIGAAKKRVFRIIYFIIGLESVMESAPEWSQD
jgi:hypothetical protein